MKQHDNPQADLQALGVSEPRAQEMVSLAKAAAGGRDAARKMWAVVDTVTEAMSVDHKDRVEDRLARVTAKAANELRRDEAEALLVELLSQCRTCRGEGEHTPDGEEDVRRCSTCGGAGYEFDGMWLRPDRSEDQGGEGERHHVAMRNDLRPYRLCLEDYARRRSSVGYRWQGPWRFSEQDYVDGLERILARQGKETAKQAPRKGRRVRADHEA